MAMDGWKHFSTDSEFQVHHRKNTIQQEKNMKKWLIKILMPSAEKMAEMAAGVAADFVNKSDKE